MTTSGRWVIASSNPGKLAELKTLIRDAGLHFELIGQTELGIEPADEAGLTFVENALTKARHAARQSGLPAIADDSGLAVAALGGAPGVWSARFAGPGADDAANVAKLLEALDRVEADRRACFYCAIVALEHPEDPAPLISTGCWNGTIAREPAGRAGFGYDPVFFDPRLGCTASELAPEVKNRVSHRGQALRTLAIGLVAKARSGLC
jgi:XTP/dITP diphosphohydrolase